MAEITNEMMDEAKRACEMSFGEAVVTFIGDVAGPLIGGAVVGGEVAGPYGSMAGGTIGGLAGVVHGLKEIATPDGACVANVLQEKSRGK